MMRKYMRDFSESKFFENIIFLIVLLNTLSFSMSGYLKDPDQIEIMDGINLYIIYAFISEMGFKIIAYGIYGTYLKNNY